MPSRSNFLNYSPQPLSPLSSLSGGRDHLSNNHLEKLLYLIISRLKSSGFLLLFICLFSLLLSSPALSAEPTSSVSSEVQHVLIINSYHQRMTWVKDILKATEDILQPEQTNLVFHVENMDTKQFYHQDYFDQFAATLEVKYRDVAISLILSSDNHAFDFLLAHRDTLFPNVPVSFCGVNGLNDEELKKLSGSTGVIEAFEARKTLELALGLHPKTKEVFIINDYLKTGRAWELAMRKQLIGLEKRVRLTFAENLAMKDLQEKISTLGPDTLILLGVYFADRDGRYSTYEKTGALLTEVSHVPVYCLLEFNMGQGVVGGNLISGYGQGETMATLARRLLQGESPDSLPIIKEGSTRYVFDYLQLKRFNIDFEGLPSGSIIINRPDSFYAQNRTLILASVLVFALLTFSILMLSINIIRRKRAEIVLMLTQRNVDNASQAIFIVDENGRLSYVNYAACSFLGYSKEELQSMTVADIDANISKEDWPTTWDEDRSSGTRSFESIHISSSGTQFPVEVTVNHFITDDDEYNVCYVIDISERKKAEEDLLAANDQLENRVMERTADLEEVNICLEKSLAKAQQLSSTLEIRNGEIENKNGELETAYDELKAAQSKMLHQEKMASIGQLAAGVAHEINNPMGFVGSNLRSLSKYVERLIGHIDLQCQLLLPLADPTVREQLKIARKETKLDYIIEDTADMIDESLDGVERVREIVKNLKSFSRIDTKSIVPSNINDCLDSTINIIWNEVKYKAELLKEYGCLPLVNCHAQQLNQVFLNLIVNASDALVDKGLITVKTWSDESYVFVSVSDNGEGIPLELQNRIFEPFFTTKDVGKGTGLGMSIAYDIIKNHTGEINVESEPGIGTTFTVKLPIAA